jgi:hypothetical protein
MSPQPFDPSELGADDHSLDEVAVALERYATASDQVAPPGLTGRVATAVEAEPLPRRSWLHSFGGGWMAGGGTRAMGIVTLAAAAVLIAIAVGGVVDLARRTNVGGTPPPVVSPSMSVTPSPSATDEGSGSPSSSPSPSAAATATDDDDDNSGPGGGGGDDSSGPGGGGDDDSGTGSSDSSGSGDD